MVNEKNRRKWSPVGKYAMRSEPWQISKAYLDGCTLYQVWNDAEQGPLKTCNDFSEAKEWIKEREQA